MEFSVEAVGPIASIRGCLFVYSEIIWEIFRYNLCNGIELLFIILPDEFNCFICMKDTYFTVTRTFKRKRFFLPKMS
jgi:hypothetical protein